MKDNKTALVFDFGASGGRAMLCRYEKDKFFISEVHRFANEPVNTDGTLYWNFDMLTGEMLEGIEKACENGGFDSIGVDTWGVDFGLLDENGNLLEAPVHYRDGRTAGLSQKVADMIGERRLYDMTGTQRMDINTLFQLYSLKLKKPKLLKAARQLLLMPDLFNYFLCGETHAELTIASTTQMLDLKTKSWNIPLLSELGIPTGILPEIAGSGTRAGMLKNEICSRCKAPRVPVISVASHDTASAVLAVPAKAGENFIFISCGTWSLLGTQRREPIIGIRSQKANLTNEIGFGGSVTFLKNIIGLWLIQETRRQFAREGHKYSYAEMETLARKSKPFACFIDPDAPQFVPAGDIPERIRDFCKKTGQYVPQNDGEIIRCIYESLAMKYRFSFNQITSCTEEKYTAVHLVGGGTKDGFLCRMAADAMNLPVIAGPVEATALGNAAAQFIALGEFNCPNTARAAIGKSFELSQYNPEKPEIWAGEYEKFRRIVC